MELRWVGFSFLNFLSERLTTLSKARNHDLKCLKNLFVSPSSTLLLSSRTRNSSTGKMVSTPGKRLGLPSKIDDVIAKWKKTTLPVTRTPISGYLKVSFMVDFAPFSAVLVNCQFYRLNNIKCFFSWWQMCSCGTHQLWRYWVIFRFFLTFRGFRLFSLEVLDIQLPELSPFLPYLMSSFCLPLV